MLKPVSIIRGFVALIASAIYLSSTAAAADRIRLDLSWLPQAEYGGFYQALADGTYAHEDLDVIIEPGGPQKNLAQLLAAGRSDVILGNSSIVLNAVAQGLDFVAIAAFLQIEPTMLFAHDDPGIKSFSDLKGHPAAVTNPAVMTYWPLLKMKYGFSDEQIRPYPYSYAFFIANADAIQQGFVTSDLGQLRRQGIKVKTFLLADYGYRPYGNLVITTRKFATEHPEMLRRFVSASSVGWKNFLHGNSSRAKALILAGNEDYTSENFDDAKGAMIEGRFVEGGDAASGGIGIMTDERWKEFFRSSVEAGVYPGSVDYRQAYTLDFVKSANLTKP